MLRRVMTAVFILLVVLTGMNRPTFAAPHIDLAEDETAEVPADDRRFFITGYGEMHYNNIDNADDELDMHRFVFGFGYDFSDKVRFRSEVELEHGFSEMYIEFAYLDFELAPWMTIRAGSLILPIGVINQYHEPTVFYGVERPEVERFIIPTTWMEGGFGIHGRITDGLDYQLYGHTSLTYNDGFMGDTGFTSASGIRGGRGKVAEANANNFAGSGRLQYTGVKGLRVGASGFFGNTAQGDTRVSGGQVIIGEADARYTFEGIEVEGLIASVFNADAGEMTTALRTDGIIGATDVIGSRMLGWRLEAAYHLLHHAVPSAAVDLAVFGRWESYDTHSAVPSGFAANTALDRNTYTFGVNFWPVDEVVLKADYSVRDNGANTANNQFNVGIGYAF